MTFYSVMHDGVGGWGSDYFWVQVQKIPEISIGIEPLKWHFVSSMLGAANILCPPPTAAACALAIVSSSQAHETLSTGGSAAGALSGRLGSCWQRVRHVP